MYKLTHPKTKEALAFNSNTNLKLKYIWKLYLYAIIFSSSHLYNQTNVLFTKRELSLIQLKNVGFWLNLTSVSRYFTWKYKTNRVHWLIWHFDVISQRYISQIRNYYKGWKSIITVKTFFNMDATFSNCCLNSRTVLRLH